MNYILDKVKKFITTNNLITKGDRLLLCISGGEDSVALLYIFLSLKEEMELSLNIFNLDHSLRESSSSESSFVKNLAKKNNIPFYGFKRDINEYSKENNLNLEEAARKVRYFLIEKTLQDNHINKALTAHHLKDNSESVLMNIIRGCGLEGLKGIGEKNHHNIIRPILILSKEEIKNYIKENNYSFVVDESNFDTTYTRNNIRHNIIPKLNEINPKCEEHIYQLGKISKEVLDFIKQEADKFPIEIEKNKKSLDYEAFIPLHNALKREILFRLFDNRINITSKYINDILLLCENNKNTSWDISINNNLTFSRRYNKLLLWKKDIISPLGEYTLPLKEGVYIFTKENFAFNLKKVKKSEINFANPYVKFIDYDKIKGNLTIRSKKEKDEIPIVNAKGKKSLKKLFIDLKIPKEERGIIPILSDDEKILWVVGIALSDKVKIDEATKEILAIQFETLEGKNE